MDEKNLGTAKSSEESVKSAKDEAVKEAAATEATAKEAVKTETAKAETAKTKTAQETGGGKEFLKELVKDIVIAAAIVAAVSVFFRPTLVKETSMEPNIDNNDYLIMSRQAYHFGDIRRGDVVIFKSDLKDDNGRSKLLIKRAIGLPGDIITIKDGELWINGARMEEDYIAEGGTSGEINNLIVPEGQIFAMGDHREVSIDSRELGCIDKKTVKGKAVFRLFPFSKMGAI